MAKFKTSSHAFKLFKVPSLKVKQAVDNPLRFQIQLEIDIDFSALLIGGGSKTLAKGIEKILGAKR